MLLIHAKNLECDGISYKSARRIRFQGNSFVRGITFSKRLYRITDVLYQEEIAADSACMIVDEESFFTLWRQTSNLDQTSAVQANVSHDNSVQAFVQRVAVAKRATFSKLTSSIEKNTCRQTPDPIPDSQNSMGLPEQNGLPSCATANPIESSQPKLLTVDQAQPVAAVPADSLAPISSQHSVQDLSAIMTDPFSCPW